jgi:hypothetical protein
MRHPSRTVLSIAASVLWLAGPTLAVAGQRGHGGPPPQAHPPTQSHAGGNGGGHSANKPSTPHAGSTASASTPSYVARIQQNPQLSSRLTPLLPSGTSLESAAQGFKNQGQFIAALHVSKNLDIPFDQLKTEMTGANHHSLGQAIETLKPNTNGDKEAKTAEDEAKADVKAASAKGNASASNRGRKDNNDRD